MDEVFISYRRSDEAHAIRLAKALEEAGLSIWWDREIPPGKSFDEVIESALDAAKCVVVLWSSKSVRSDWVKSEAAEGMARGVLVPVMVERVKPPLAFRRIEAADLVDWQGEPDYQEFSQLLTVVRELVAGEGKRLGVTSTLLKAYPREKVAQPKSVEPQKVPPPPPPEPVTPEPQKPSPAPIGPAPRSPKKKTRWGLWAILALVVGGGAIAALVVAIVGIGYIQSFDGGTFEPPPDTSLGQITVTNSSMCNVSFSLTIGGQTFFPNGNPAQLHGVPLGYQPYQISGNITCNNAVFNAVGYGEIQVRSGADYGFSWPPSRGNQIVVSLVESGSKF